MKARLFVFAVLVAATAIDTRAQAQNYPWCAYYSGGEGGVGGTNCGFTSFEQCLADVSGIGGFCEENNIYGPPSGPAPSPGVKHRPRSAS